MRTRIWVAIVLTMGALVIARGQCPSAGFAAPATACLGESIYLANSSTGAASYQWDFCSGDLGLAPSPSVSLTSPLLFRARSFRMVQSANSWYGFAIDQNSFLLRLSFGNSPDNIPTITTIGSLGGAIQFALDLKFWQEGSNWFALIANTSANNLLLLSFGSDLTTVPTVTDLGSYGGSLKGPAGIDLVREAGNVYALVTNSTAAEVVRLTFGSSITNTALANVIPVPGPSSLHGISVTRECDHWFALATDNGANQIYYLDFALGIANAPSTGMLNIPSSAYGSPSGIAVVNEGGLYYAFIQSVFPSNVYRIDFGSSIIDLTGVYNDLGNLNINTAPANSQFNGAFEMISSGSTWTAFSVDLSGPGGVGYLLRLNFPLPCTANFSVSNATNPSAIQYSAPGSYRQSLTASAADGTVSHASAVVAVGNGVAPDIDFASQNVCVNNNINFTTSNSSGNIVSYSWTFGDTGIATGSSTTHVYSTAGLFDVRLSVSASNGCSNQVAKPLQVYNVPIADFNLPVSLPVCTNQPYTFSNISTFDPGSNPTWEWRINGSLVSAQQNYVTSFANPVSQDIRLKALLPGCEDEQAKVISTVLTGPTVAFNVADNCQGTVVPFTNTTTGIVDAGYTWNFGDATGSTLVNPTHTYSAPGNFSVTLTGSNSAGCQNSQTKPVRIYSLPQPNFSVGLPPFSCSNSLTSFQNLTPGLSDSNITSWTWQFGDPASGTSNQANPTYTYLAAGTFNVQLTAGTSAGCTASITKPTTISPSPTADFTVGPSCLNQSTKFTDISSGGVQSRLWIIGSSTFAIPNPSYTFNATGNFPATLTVTSANGCTSVKNRTVNVPVPPVQNFSVSESCERKISVFTDTTPTVPDAIVGWNWNFDGNSVSGNPSTYIFPVQGTYNVKMTTTYTSGCRYTLAKDVVIKPTPIAAFTATPQSGAAPLTVQFENASTQATSYLWKFYEKVTAMSTHISPVHTFTSLGDYSAELTASNAQGCSDVLTTPIHVVVPNIDLILSDFTLVKDGATGKLKPRVTIINNSNISFNLAEINLFLSGNAVVNETVIVNLNPGQSVSQTLSFTLSPDQFDLQYLCAEINSEKDIQKDNNRRCINFSDGDYFFSPYPNPSPGVTHVDWVSNASGVAKVTVFDSMGKKAYQWETPSHAGLNQAVLDLEFLTSGFYYITVETTFSKKTSRFMRQ